MEIFAQYLVAIENTEHRSRIEEVLCWIVQKFPSLSARIAWNQPMFTDHGTFIIGFSVAKKHLAVSPEPAGMAHFTEDIAKSGYSQGKMLFRIPWNDSVDYALLEKIITFNIDAKADCKTFWRK